ncbi:unnamed protein product [Caenorhabditis bovis]|uniref:Serpentine Receptor, class H n=1 Tax=Caenorhabditis bovis TaxID=2654633 RepID=A0A8S1EE55_9PELO|nr:unnamed protein product [Caenorhabditis bovis]
MTRTVEMYKCLQQSPQIYRLLMHYLHLVTIPLYSVSIYVLVSKTTKVLKNYKNYLLWHILGNIVFEVYISLLMLPMTYLPFPVFRSTGILMHFDLNGLLAFYALMYLIMHIFISILEMFRYRYNVAIDKTSKSYSMVRNLYKVNYGFCILSPIIAGCALPSCLSHQLLYKNQLFDKYNDAVPIEIMCNTTVIAPPFSDTVMILTLIIIVILCILGGIIITTTTRGILKKLDEMRSNMSARTVALQRMLLISLVVQGLVHCIMLIIPIATFLYAIVYVLTNDVIAYIGILVISFHGPFSTIAMIIFTKPVQDGIKGLFRPIVERRSTIQLSAVAISWNKSM